jgi:hypothetical protein
LSTLLTKFKLAHKVKDDAFTVESIPRYHLSLQLGSENFRFCIIDLPEKRCLWIEDYRFSTTIFFTEQLLDQLNLIYDDHHILQAGFWRTIRVAFNNQKFTLVPQSLFKPEYAHQYLQLSVETPSELEDTLYYRHPGNEAISIFSVEKRITDWFRDAYPAKNVSFVHQTSVFLEGLQHQHSNIVESSQLYVCVEHSYLIITVINQRKLMYCNLFPYMSVQDFIYFVMLVMNELEINPDACRVVLYGELSHDSSIFSSLYKYVRHLSFGSKPGGLKFSYQFDEVLDHRYFDLYSIHFCE